MVLNRVMYSEYCKKYRMLWRYLMSCSIDRYQVVEEICSLRGYDYNRMAGVLLKAGFIRLDPDKFNIKHIMYGYEEMGIFNKSENFILGNGGYIFPVMDMLGNVVALIEWNANARNDESRKYITTPSKLFSKAAMFYGMEQLASTGIGKKYVMVEGIFDSLSVRALGVPCLAYMGVESSRYKEALYALFRGIVAIPDGDAVGREVIEKDRWKLPSNGKYFRWRNTSGIAVKDIDDICKYYNPEDLKELFREAFNEKQKVVSVDL